MSNIIEIANIPSTVEEFVELRNKIAVTPEGGAVVFLVAFKLFHENEPLGSQCLVASVDMTVLAPGNTYKGYSMMKNDISLMQNQLKTNPFLPNSYIKGSDVNSSYKVQLPYNYVISRNAYSGVETSYSVKVFVECSGASSARPIMICKNDKGIWKAKEWSSILVGIKKPPVSDEI